MIAIKTFSTEYLGENIDLGSTEYTSQEVLSNEHMLWKHMDAPDGPSKFIGEYNSEGKLVGRLFLQRRKFNVNDDLFVPGAMVTDLLVDPKYRVASSFIALIRSIRSPQEIDIILHTSNENSDIFYKNLFKFPVRFSLNALGLPINIYGLINSIFPNLKFIILFQILTKVYKLFLVVLEKILTNLTKINFSNQPFDQGDIYSQFKKRAGPHFERNEVFNKWRFANGPIFNGNTHWIWKDKECLGYLVLKKKEIKRINFYILMDIILTRDLSTFEKIAVKLLMIKLAIQNNTDVLFTMVNLKNSSIKWLKDAPFFTIPDKYLPHPSPIFIHCKLPNSVFNKYQNIFFTLADLDYF